MRFARSSGILLHPTSLPGPHGSGDLGAGAYHFVDWLVAAGQTLWQVLPLVPIGAGNSPYMSVSAFAGNPLLIDLSDLAQRGWLNDADLSDAAGFPRYRVDYGTVLPFRMQSLRRAAARFFANGGAQDSEFASFVAQEGVWLDDYALFMALLHRFGEASWTEWEGPLARRVPAAIDSAREELQDSVQFWQFVQWNFFRQWFALKRYANQRGVNIVGDIPIFISHQSADVWARPDLFKLDTNLRPGTVAGVPPDYFSDTGQLWGNPLYRWSAHEDEGFAWWIGRVRAVLALTDIVRIDHFRGFAACWEIPADAITAVSGSWVAAPGERLFDAVNAALGKLPIIAEDLGILTPDVVELRDRFGFPGMRILQFAFGGDAANPYLPHNYQRNCVVYTGTHDNDTTRGWFTTASLRERTFAQRYLPSDGVRIHWDLIHAASRSVADIAIYPLQDILGLGTDARMNLPGTIDRNWEWRFAWDQVEDWHALRLREVAALHGRNQITQLPLPA